MTLALALWAALLLPPWPTLWTHSASADGGRPSPAARREARTDGGTAPVFFEDDDGEVIENLELLEHLDVSRDFELLLELSREDSRPAK